MKHKQLKTVQTNINALLFDNLKLNRHDSYDIEVVYYDVGYM